MQLHVNRHSAIIRTATGIYTYSGIVPPRPVEVPFYTHFLPRFADDKAVHIEQARSLENTILKTKAVFVGEFADVVDVTCGWDHFLMTDSGDID